MTNRSFCEICNSLEEIEPTPFGSSFCDKCMKKIASWRALYTPPKGVELIAFLSDSVPPGKMIYIGVKEDGDFFATSEPLEAKHVAFNPIDYLAPRAPVTLH